VREAPSHTAFRDCAGSSGRTFWMLGTAHTSISVPNAHIETANSTSATFISRRRLKLRAFGVSSWNINLTGLARPITACRGCRSDAADGLAANEVHDCQFFDGEANTSQPNSGLMPAGDPVLEVQPLPQANIISEVLAGHRTALRTQQEAARQIGVAPATFARWERVSASPQGTF
jgi:hypothetical protein